RHLPNEQEERGSPFRHLAAHLLEEIVADAVIREVGAESAHGRTKGGAKERDEEDPAEEHAPERAVPGAGAGVRPMACFRFLLALGPGHDRGILNLEQMLLLQMDG